MQTFDDWMNERIFNHLVGFDSPRSYLFDDEAYDAARMAWQAAHENAARVCEATGADWPRNQWVETGADGCDACASAIREAAK